ncbi:hypothetical protein COBT_003814, partial [Conglomerata obtusa]
TTTKFEQKIPVIIEKMNHSKTITENSDLGATFEANMNKITSKISKKNETDTTDSTKDFIPDISNPNTCKDLADLDYETIQNKTYIIKNNCDKFEKNKNATKIDTLGRRLAMAQFVQFHTNENNKKFLNDTVEEISNNAGEAHVKCLRIVGFSDACNFFVKFFCGNKSECEQENLRDEYSNCITSLNSACGQKLPTNILP